jgi:predicted regulator of Ras-like GTPase activity (Roadblock/LC7/MglB family)
MIEILRDLNQVAGVKGSMVVTRDGIVVHALLGTELDQETVAAVSSAMIQSARRAMERLGHKSFSRFILTSSWGRMVFVDLEIAYLVVITSQNIKLDVILIEIDSTAYKIRHRRAE